MGRPPETMRVGPRDEAFWLLYGLLVCLMLGMGPLLGIVFWFVAIRWGLRIELGPTTGDPNSE